MATPEQPRANPDARELELGFIIADAVSRLEARRGHALDQTSAGARGFDARRAAVKTDAAGSEAKGVLEAAERRLARSRSESERSFVPPLDPPAGVATLHGRVHGSDGAGIAGLVVRALGPDGRPRGETKSGERGYFRIDLPTDRAASGRLATIDAAAASHVPPRIAVQLTISNGREELLAEKVATLIRPDRSVYRELEVSMA